MNESDRTRPAAAAMTASEDARRRIALIVILLSAYVCANLACRWLSFTLFSGWGFGWERPRPVETAYQLFSVCLAVFPWAFLVYVGACAVPRVLNRWTLAFLAFCAVAAIELDMSWYYLSRIHITSRDVVMFLTQPLKEHFGIQNSDVIRFSMVVAVHALAIGGLVVVGSVIAGRQRLASLRGPRSAFVAIGLVVALVGDGLIVGRYIDDDRRQWQKLAYQNPLRLGLADGIWSEVSGTRRDLDMANEAVAALKREQGESRREVAGLVRLASLPGHEERRFDVIVVAIEGFNQRLMTPESMPFLSSRGRSWLTAENHYSTGNATHLGILGLAFGAPPVFYKGTTLKDLPTSKYIDMFVQRGYRVRLFSTDLVAHHYTGRYLTNFTEPGLEAKDHWKLLTIAKEELARPGRHLVLFYYGGTHYPYLHDARYHQFQPETPVGFYFARRDLYNYRQQIENRYQNTLREVDDWLRDLVGALDLDETIVVITGDHGEEIFEQGRMSHSSSLGEPQIRTPMLVHIPGRQRERVERITGHHDVMPTLVDALAWPVSFRQWGRSLIERGGEGVAVVAYNNDTNPVKRWAVITGELKSVLVGAVGERLEIEDLRRRLDDTRMSYRNERALWETNFREVARLKDDLDQATNGAR